MALKGGGKTVLPDRCNRFGSEKFLSKKQRAKINELIRKVDSGEIPPEDYPKLEAMVNQIMYPRQNVPSKKKKKRGWK